MSGVLDLQVAAAARERGTEVGYLEDVASQLAVFGEADPSVLLSIAKPDSDEAAASRSMTEDVMASCWTGDRDQLASVVERMSADAWTDALLWRRNDQWMETLTDELVAGGAFVAVGAGHMFGDRGLITQIEALGYDVRALDGVGALPEPPETLSAPPPPEPVAHDPEVVAHWATSLASETTMLCAMPGQPLTQCSTASPEVCGARVAHYMALCAEQETSLPPVDGALDPEQRKQIASCALGSAAMMGFVDDGAADPEACPFTKLVEQRLAD
jgi:hypothetical protein